MQRNDLKLPWFKWSYSDLTTEDAEIMEAIYSHQEEFRFRNCNRTYDKLGVIDDEDIVSVKLSGHLSIFAVNYNEQARSTLGGGKQAKIRCR